MKKLKIGVIDLVSQGPNKSLWARFMHPNLASIMPQVVASWCEQEGHETTFACYTGLEDISQELPKDVDLVFICAFTQAAQLSYAISNLFQSKGAVTVLGGPHARCYPDDAQKYFDFVLGFTDKKIIQEVLDNCESNRPIGLHLSANKQPASLPNLEERWKFIEPTLKKAPLLKITPLIGSMGCPYTCSFCIDSTVAYQPMDFDVLKQDLTFLQSKFKNPWVAWHDPNFGIRFNDYMGAIEESVKPGKIKHIAESSLSILTESNLKRFKKNGFVAMLPGIESWFDLGNKSKAMNKHGEEKLNRIADHVNMVLEYIPYVQTNFVLGMDNDTGDAPFELTKRFIDKSPAAFPGYSLLTSFGEAAPINLEYQREGRVLPFPFHLLNNNFAMNVKPKNYEWIDFYDRVIDLTGYTFSFKNIMRRLAANTHFTAKWMNVMRAISTEGYGRLTYFRKISKLLREDSHFKDFYDGKHAELPIFFKEIVKRDLGDLWHWLPKGALEHDHMIYSKKTPDPEVVVPAASA